MKKNLIVFGTRPEAIKMAPLIKEFKKYPAKFETRVCVTAQHREMLDQVLDFFNIVPDYDLNLMKPDQTLNSITTSIITDLKPILEEFKPDYVYVHGDTTTTMAAALAAFYFGAKVCHIEAGLRTYNKYSPFPEEINRQITTRLTEYHFAPTKISEENLLKENVDAADIIVTGNTVIDALYESLDQLKGFKNDEIKNLESIIDKTKRTIVLTGHRRENQGQGILDICQAIKEITKAHDDVQVIFPVHPSPAVKTVVYNNLSDVKNVKLIDPLSYPAFVWLMNQAYLIVTDSGGVQEEAPSLGKPVLVMRDTTERPEAVEAGTVILVGTDIKKIISECSSLLSDSLRYERMSNLSNPYGDGKACQRIVEYINSLNS